jgi:hypothetical protein
MNRRLPSPWGFPPRSRRPTPRRPPPPHLVRGLPGSAQGLQPRQRRRPLDRVSRSLCGHGARPPLPRPKLTRVGQARRLVEVGGGVGDAAAGCMYVHITRLFSPPSPLFSPPSWWGSCHDFHGAARKNWARAKTRIRSCGFRSRKSTSEFATGVGRRPRSPPTSAASELERACSSPSWP